MREKHKHQMRIWAMLCHLSALLAWILLFLLVFIGIPLYLPLNIVVPLIMWRSQKSQYAWVDFQGRESLNFQLSLTLYTLFSIVLSLLLVLTSCGIAVTTQGGINEVGKVLDSLLFIWMLLITALLLWQLFLVPFAAIKAYNGEYYRYPLTMRVLR